jgi:hypothetical protein
MAISHAMWVHGHGTCIEYPERMTAIARRGPAARLDGEAGSTNWLHLAVPTTVITHDVRLRIHSAMIRFKGNGVSIVSVHIYDGESRIATVDDLAESSTVWATPRWEVPNAPEIRWGVGISFKVSYGSGSTRRLEVSGGGADFVL